MHPTLSYNTLGYLTDDFNSQGKIVNGLTLFLCCFQVELIRRVNKLWTNDNIHIFKTINIPVKLTFDNGECTLNNDIPGTSRDTKLHRPQECDSEESVDSGVHEVNHGDISIDIEGHSRIASEGSRANKGASSNSEDSLNSFLKKLDGEMKASIQKAKKQRYDAGFKILGVFLNFRACTVPAKCPE